MKTSPMIVTLIDYMGSDLSVVNAARVSFHKESSSFQEQDAKLISYLAKHKHTSPFNHCFISVRVKAPIFVARQLVKHKFLPWNEVSRRYVDEEPEFYITEVWRAKVDNVKQGSGGPLEKYDFNFMRGIFDALDLYKEMLKEGVCAEQARMVLPQNTMTEWIWSGSLGAFADMLRLRLHSHTQAETRQVAQKIKALIEPLFPVSLSALLGEQE